MFPKLCKDLLKYSRIQRCTCRLFNSPRRQPASKSSSAGRFLLLVCPATCLCLAYWQVKRKKWKEDLIAKIKERYEMEPVELPKDLSELEDLDLYPVKVRGHFDYTNEVYIGPKTDSPEKGADGQKYSFMYTEGKTPGIHVITPFKLADRDETILVNRGWYDNVRFYSKEIREKGQVHGEQEIVGILRRDQNTQAMFWSLMLDFDHPEKKNGCDVYYVRKVDVLARRCGTVPVFLDAKIDKKSPYEPKPIELGIELRNNHQMYIFTWLSLAFITTAMWYSRYSAPVRTSGVNAYISKQNAGRKIGKPNT